MSDRAGERVAIIRTSDRGGFRACRRKWDFQSHLRRNLEPKQDAKPLWFGTGIHFALEWFFDTNTPYDFANIEDAFRGYVLATRINARQELPEDWQEAEQMGIDMLHYLTKFWLQTRNPLKTFVYKGVPQLEINFQIEIPFDIKAHFPNSPYDKAIYSGTIDRVVIDDENRLWGLDYKTAKAMKSSHFANDPQATVYPWAMNAIYPEHETAGLIYWQLLKASPKPPTPLKSGKISVAQNMKTSRPLYRQALIDAFGSVEKAPPGNVDYLNQLAMQESTERDAYVRRDKVYQNRHSQEAEGVKIMQELQDMLNPDLLLYPNPTFMCPHMCSFFEECISMNDGSDWEGQLEMNTQQRARSDESWRAALPKAIEKLYKVKETVDFDNPIHLSEDS